MKGKRHTTEDKIRLLGAADSKEGLPTPHFSSHQPTSQT